MVHIFTDGSVNGKRKIGYGAYLIVSDLGLSFDVLKSQIKIKRFENTSSTQLELLTLLWALETHQLLFEKIYVYTDSQNIVGLLSRRAYLEDNDYFSKKNKRLNHYELYQSFYQLSDRLNCEFIKVQGHQKQSSKNAHDKWFTLVDRASRQALRNEFA